MNKKLNLLVMLVGLLAFGFMLSGCGDSGNGATLKVVNNSSYPIVIIEIKEKASGATAVFWSKREANLVPAGDTKTFSGLDAGTGYISIGYSEDGSSNGWRGTGLPEQIFDELGKTTTVTLGADLRLTVGLPE